MTTRLDGSLKREITIDGVAAAPAARAILPALLVLSPLPRIRRPSDFVATTD